MSRDWLAAFECLFSVISLDLPHEVAARHGVVETIRQWKERMPHLLVNERYHFEGEHEAAGIRALHLTLVACAKAIEGQDIDPLRSLPTASQLVSVLETARPLQLVHLEWQMRTEACRSHFGDTISTQLVNSRPTHYIDGTAITVLAWRAWLNAADAGTLSHSVRQATHRPARETTIFATIRWMYYALWCQRITLETMPSHETLLSSIRQNTVLIFGATRGEVGWANKVGIDVAFLHPRMLHEMGKLGHSAPPAILQPQPQLTGHTGWQERSLLKPRLGFRTRKIYGVDA